MYIQLNIHITNLVPKKHVCETYFLDMLISIYFIYKIMNLDLYGKGGDFIKEMPQNLDIKE